MYNYASRLMLSVHTFCTATSIPGFLQPRASRTSLCCWRARAVWMLCLWGGATSPKPIAGWPSSDVVSEFSTSTRRGLAFWLQVTAGYCRFVIHGHHMDTGGYTENMETSCTWGGHHGSSPLEWQSQKRNKYDERYVFWVPDSWTHRHRYG